MAMIGTLARALRRRPRDVVSPLAAPASVESLAAAIAALDARRESRDATLDGEWYARERAALKGRLSAALAAESVTP
jgi:hypothetical protein